MTITQLEYLIAVDTHKNFAKAADSCFVTQPTLSMQIKKVEEELGVLVFDRSKKPVLTTEIGREIISQARLSLLEVSRIKEIIQNQKEEIKGELRVGIIPTLSPYLLPLFITDFIDNYPDVSLVFEELLTSDILRKLSTDQLDLGILVTPLQSKSIIEIPLFYEPFYLYVSDSHPLSNRDQLSYKDLDVNDMWLLKEGHCFRSQMLNLCGDRKTRKPQLNFESGSLETLKRVVDCHYGYTLLPDLARRDLDESKRQNIRSFKDPQPVREVSMVIHRSFMKRRLIELLKTEILKNIPDSLKEKGTGSIIDWKE